MIASINIKRGEHPASFFPFTNIEEGKYLIQLTRLNPQKEEKVYRALYFAKLDYLCKEVGEKRYDLHDIIKNLLIQGSTADFTPDDWLVFLETFELWAFTEYNVILP